MANGKRKVKFNKASLLLKLTVDRDLRTNEKKEIKTGRIAYFFEVVRNKFNEMIKAGLFFLLFMLPFVALIVFLRPYLVAQALLEFNFTDYMGIGYSVSADSVTQGVIATYGVYKKILLLSYPALIVASIGAAGLFYCSRGFMWDEPVIVYKAFFRGIKKLVKYFLPTFAGLGLIAVGAGYGILYNLEKIQSNTADFLSHFVMAISFIAGFLAIMISIFLMPMFACYKFKYKDYLKNSVLLNILVTPPTIMLGVVSVVPFILLGISGQFQMILILVIFLIGFVFIAMMWTGYAQNIFETMIGGMYSARLEAERKKAEKSKKPEKQEFVNPKKKYKKKATDKGANG